MFCKKVMVIGAGTMGSGIAQVFAQNGCEVILNDIKQEFIDGGKAKIDKSLTKLVSKGKMAQEDKDAIMSRVTGFVEITAENMKDVDLVVEAAIENMKIKAQIFKNLDEKCPAHTILASNTSSLPITSIGAATGRPDKVIGMHFFNPAPVMKLLEIINGIATSEETYNKVAECATELGKTPVKVQDFPGFAGNRIVIPMLNEAIFALMEGVASKEDIDKIWDRFYKSDSSRGRDKKGSGLGLSITKEVIQAHGENIDVVSTVGVGTEFIFTLELAK